MLLERERFVMVISQCVFYKMKMGCFSITHQTVWRFVSWTVIVVSLLGKCAASRGSSCPVYQDLEWQKRDGKCDPGKKYHCFENERGDVESDGCFIEKTCARGAHPVVDHNHIRCAYCQTGFQRQEMLKSSTYTFSFCERHSAPCKAEYGETQCRAGTRDWDRACTCNASLGFFPRIDGEDCGCFTPNDACSGCKFRGCPNGTVKNSKGVCGPIPMVILTPTTPPGSHTQTSSALSTTARAHDHSTGLQGGEIAAIVVSVIVVIVIGLLVLCVRKKWYKRCSRCTDDEVNPENKNGAVPVDTHNSEIPMIQQNGNPCSIEEEEEKVAPEDSLDSKTPMIVQNGGYYQAEHVQLAANANAIINISAVHFNITGGNNVTVSSYELDPSSTSPLMGRDPSTLQRTPDVRNPSTSRCDPPPASVSSALPSAETPCERVQLLPTPQSVPVPADLPATSSSLPGPAPQPPLSEPSAPPPSILEPSAPLLSLSDPTAPLPSFHVVDQSLMEDEGNPGDMQQSEDDETQRKLPHISHHSEVGEACLSEVDETSKKLPYSSHDSVVDVATPLSSSPDQGTPCNETMEPAFSEQQSVNGKAGPVSVTCCGDGPLPRRMNPVNSIHTDEEKINLRSRRTDDKNRISGFQAHAGTVYSQVTDDDSADVVLNVIA